LIKESDILNEIYIFVFGYINKDYVIIIKLLLFIVHE